jgi:hypothetical protein
MPNDTASVAVVDGSKSSRLLAGNRIDQSRLTSCYSVQDAEHAAADGLVLNHIAIYACSRRYV